MGGPIGAAATDCPQPGHDGTIWGTDASVTRIGADVPGFLDLDGDGADDVTQPSEVPDGQWPGDTKGVAYDEPFKTVYVDDRDFTGTLDDTLGPGQSPTEATLGQNIHVADLRTGDEGGIWMYAELNGVSDLQRGGPSVPGQAAWELWNAFNDAEVPPIVLLPPDQDRPVLHKGLTLFPDGDDPVEVDNHPPPEDPCSQSEAPDTLLW